MRVDGFMQESKNASDLVFIFFIEVSRKQGCPSFFARAIHEANEILLLTRGFLFWIKNDLKLGTYKKIKKKKSLSWFGYFT